MHPGHSSLFGCYCWNFTHTSSFIEGILLRNWLNIQMGHVSRATPAKFAKICAFQDIHIERRSITKATIPRSDAQGFLTLEIPIISKLPFYLREPAPGSCVHSRTAKHPGLRFLREHNYLVTRLAPYVPCRSLAGDWELTLTRTYFRGWSGLAQGTANICSNIWYYRSLSNVHRCGVETEIINTEKGRTRRVVERVV